ncbi:MAG: O-antigen ligase family protein [Bacteroidales bacterium]|nr:O-antigen ligase family protein [Bacteroidales bacterium]MBN2755793.1 O-antigen ligase family protein [Bacteroidales bacterium]
MKIQQKNRTQIYLASFIFILLNTISTFYGYYYVNLISIALIFIYLAFFNFDKLFLAAVFLTPLSIPLDEFFNKLEFNLSIPSEGIFAILLLIIILKFIKSKEFINHEILKHPVSFAIYFYIFWIFITSITSSLPIVSFKFLLVKLWFIIPVYFFSITLFYHKKNINRFLWLYILSLTIVIIYTISRHLSYGFYDKIAAHIVMSPFYNDHTSYGAILAMFVPVLGYFSFSKETKKIYKAFIILLMIIFILALILSYTRAAWISLVVALLFGLIIYLKINIKLVIFSSFVLIFILFTYRIEIIDKLNKNKQDSSTELSEHVKSISNIATDASNLERINRWNSAIKMFGEKPVLGWGPGTYMFIYAPFQMSKDKTIISTNFGEVGNAHSEYIGPLAEQGIFGLISFLIIIFLTIKTSLNVYSKSKQKDVKLLVLTLLIALTSYFVHGLLNNYLDTDKASVPFWGFIAIIVYLDIAQKNNSLK